MNRAFIALAAVVFCTCSVLADFEGTVTAKDKDSITVKNADGKEVRYDVTKDTAVEGPKGKLDIDKVQVGSKVSVKAARENENTAESIKLEASGDEKNRQPKNVVPKNRKKIQLNPANVQVRPVPVQPKDDNSK